MSKPPLAVLNWSGHVHHDYVGSLCRWRSPVDRSPKLSSALGFVSAAIYQDGRYHLFFPDYCMWVPADECVREHP